MTKKDYILIAGVLLDSKNYIDNLEYCTLCMKFGEMLKQDNTRFDFARFLEACGLEIKGGLEIKEF